MSTKKPGFEESIETLEQLVKQMESGQMSLEESLKAYEEGVSLIKSCQDELTKAKQKVQMLSKKTELNDLEINISNEPHDENSD